MTNIFSVSAWSNHGPGRAGLDTASRGRAGRGARGGTCLRLDSLEVLPGVLHGDLLSVNGRCPANPDRQTDRLEIQTFINLFADDH